jgi:hypothetical protein
MSHKGGKPSAIRITMTLNEAYIHTADDNAQADVLEEAIQEKIDSVITDSLTSTDGEQAEFDPSIARSATGTTVASNTVASTDEVIVNKVVADGSVESKIMKISELKAQGFSDAQIAGTEPSGINGVTFRIGTGA